jgi:hypothetical protein
MTYEEALELKIKIGETIIHNGITMNVFVAPKSNNKIGLYFAQYRDNPNSFKDSYSKKYADDNNFICIGLTMDISGDNVLHKYIYE